MSRQPWDPDGRSLFTRTIVLPMCMALSACGGGGDDFVASIPPPPVTPTLTPTPSPALPAGTVAFNYAATNPVDVRTSWLDSPANRLGTTDVIGLVTVFPGSGGQPTTRMAGAGEFTVTTSQQQLDHRYALNTTGGNFPAGIMSIAGSAAQRSWEINDSVAYLYGNPYGDTPQYFGQRLGGFSTDGKQLFSYDYSRASGGGAQLALNPNQKLQSSFIYDVGYSYAAMGEWSWQVVDLDGKLAGDSDKLLFVNGDRTPAGAIPVSGTATYDARTLLGWVKAPFALTADFGARTMAARIDQDYRYNASGDSMDDPEAVGIHVAGTAGFSNDGLFNIPLSGTANIGSGYLINLPTTPPSQAVTGMMNGAFFGPQAEQVGGSFFLQNSGGVQLMQDAFVGQQRRP